MTEKQWQTLLRVLDGELFRPLPVGFIIDSPWLAGWYGVSYPDYFSDDQRWLEANLRAAQRFPDVLFLPGFWSEFGMCTEPSAFGAKCIWPEREMPFPQRVCHDCAEINRLQKPDCRTDGLLPFVIKRLQRAEEKMEIEGHQIRFATCRGPMNIATYLLGHTETLIGLRTNPNEIHTLLRIVTDFIVDWLRYQAALFPSIDGILILDDLIGFVGQNDFQQFVIPYFKEISAAVDVSVKALHNDCHGLVTAKFLKEMGFNLFNFSFEHSLSQIRQLAGDTVTLLGNIPPRDVLAQGTREEVAQSVATALSSMEDQRRLILSAGGGVPPGVPTGNLDAFCAAVAEGS
jgi:uroporphyrinogen decarboxylase